jgi:hypothetical protein
VGADFLYLALYACFTAFWMLSIEVINDFSFCFVGAVDS